MKDVFEPTEIKATGQAKRTWSSPAFEIISKEVIKAGTDLGPESTSVLQES